MNVEDNEAHPTRHTLRKLFQKHLPAIQHLYSYTCSFIDTMVYLKDALRGKVSLTHLTIKCHGPSIAMSTSYLWSILLEFPQLEEFWFEFRGCDSLKKENSATKIPKGLQCPQLRRIGISGVVIPDESVEILCCICPNLEEMEIDGVNRFCIL